MGATEAQNRRGKQKPRSVAHIVDLHINRAIVAAAAAEPVADGREEGLRNVRAERAEPRSKFCPAGGCGQNFLRLRRTVVGQHLAGKWC